MGDVNNMLKMYASSEIARARRKSIYSKNSKIYFYIEVLYFFLLGSQI